MLSYEAEFIEGQLDRWPEARTRYADLGKTLRRPMKIGPLNIALQYNPARIVSTGAKTDKVSLAARPCFLCASNRPAEQVALPVMEGWELLVNPFPIFPIHFIIASTTHQPQERVPEDIAALAEQLPGLAVFYNGARAGASAPDHLHLQAVLKEELPLLNWVETFHPVGQPGLLHSSSLLANWFDKTRSDCDGELKDNSITDMHLPFSFYSAVITPDDEGMRILIRTLDITGHDPVTGLKDWGLINAFFWIDATSGLLRAVMIPRKAHRPACYPKDPQNPNAGEFLISPGAIDMTGLMIVPRENDYLGLKEDDIIKIYQEVAEQD